MKDSFALDIGLDPEKENKIFVLFSENNKHLQKKNTWKKTTNPSKTVNFLTHFPLPKKENPGSNV